MIRKKNKWALTVLALSIELCACTSKVNYVSRVEEQNDYHVVFFENKEYSYNTNLKNVLVLGIDDPELNGQADFIGLFTFDRKNKKIYLTNIPRETKTTVTLYEDEKDLGQSEVYLNMVYPFAEYKENGAKETRKKVSSLLEGIPVDDYFVCSTDILKDFVDMFGEIEVVLPNDSLSYLNEAWVKGSPFVVNKDTIETYLRSRDTNTSESAKARRERQNLYIKSVESKIKNVDEEKVLEVYSKSLTSLKLEDIEALLELGYKEQEFTEIPGSYTSSDYYDEFILDKEKIKEFVVRMFYVEV